MSTATTLFHLPQRSPLFFCNRYSQQVPSHQEDESIEILEEDSSQLDQKYFFIHQETLQKRRKRSIRMANAIGINVQGYHHHQNHQTISVSPAKFNDIDNVEIMVASPSSSPQSPRSPIQSRRSSSPIEQFFKTLTRSTSTHFQKNNSSSTIRPGSPRFDRLRRRSRSGSASAAMQLQNPEPANHFGSLFPDTQRQQSPPKRKEVPNSRKVSPTTAIEGYKTKQQHPQPAVHFRPIPFEVKAELDNFFGQTKGQKRDLALRTKGEDGHLWFDKIEQEEFAHLLPSTPNTPLHTSRRSSVATMACRSPVDAYSRRGSNISSTLLITPRTPGCQDVASFNYMPMSDMDTSFVDSYDGFDPSERRRKRSKSVLMRGNVVQDHEPLRVDFDNDEEVEDGERGRRLHQSNADIAMPAFLPLKRHQASTALLDEAFASATTTNNNNNNPNHQIGEEQQRPSSPPSLSSRLDSKGRKRPANLQLHFKDVEDLNVPSPRRKTRPMSMTVSPGGLDIARNNPFDDAPRPRGASFDIDTISPKKVRSQQMGLPAYLLGESSPLEVDYHAQPVEDAAKAATVLGMNAGNRNLLVPGGLPTGEHVYDGLDIPCRSIHLSSDDEDDEDTGKEKRSLSNEVRKWLKSRTS